MADNYLNPRLFMPPGRNALNQGGDPWAWRSDMDAPKPGKIEQALMKPGPAPTGRDRVFDMAYGWLGGLPENRATASALMNLFDVGTMGMVTGAYDGVRELAQTGRPVDLAMALMPGSKIPMRSAQALKGLPLKNIVPSRWLGSTPAFDLEVVPRYANVPHSKLSLDHDGTMYFDVPWNSNWSSRPEGAPSLSMFDPGSRMSRFTDEFLWPYADDVFIRSSIGKADFNHLKSGKHRGSKNHATGSSEGGLSVAHRPEPGDSYKYSYFVRGKRIGRGSDGEPLLDVGSAEPISDVYKTRDIVDLLVNDKRAYRESLGLSWDDVRAIDNARFKK